KVAARILAEQVPRMEPPVLQGHRRGLWIVVVALQYSAAPNQQLARLPGRDLDTPLIHDTGLTKRRLDSAGARADGVVRLERHTQARADFRHAVGLARAEPESAFDFRVQILAEPVDVHPDDLVPRVQGRRRLGQNYVGQEAKLYFVIAYPPHVP